MFQEYWKDNEGNAFSLPPCFWICKSQRKEKLIQYFLWFLGQPGISKHSIGSNFVGECPLNTLSLYNLDRWYKEMQCHFNQICQDGAWNHSFRVDRERVDDFKKKIILGSRERNKHIILCAALDDLKENMEACLTYIAHGELLWNFQRPAEVIKRWESTPVL